MVDLAPATSVAMTAAERAQFEADGYLHWGWHQDGGRQNREVETDPRPPAVGEDRLLAIGRESDRERQSYDHSWQPQGKWLDGPPQRSVQWPAPPGAIEVPANPGDALLFDRRLWHVRSENYSDLTRVAAFFG